MITVAPSFGIHDRVNDRVDTLIADAAALRLGVGELDNGSRVVDAGIDARGSLEAGRRIAEIGLGGLARVAVAPSDTFGDWPWQVEVSTSQPVVACLGCQYAGWSLRHDEPKFRALGSGPGRLLARKEPLFAELSYRETAARTCLVLETDRPPPAQLAARVAADCGVDDAGLTLILTPTGSLAGVVQIAARVVEVALHKTHELKFPLDAVVDAVGRTPLPPPTADGMAAMGRTNDTILFGGQVQLWVDAADDDAEALARALPSGGSRDYGKPFAQVFADYGHDFFKIDPLLFSPAEVWVSTLGSGRTFRAGRLDATLLRRSFQV